MASATFRMGSAATLGGPFSYGAYDSSIDVTALYYVKVELQSTTGVNRLEVSIVGTDEGTTAPVVTVDQATKTATFRMPAVASTVLVQCRINGGINADAETMAAWTSQLAVHVLCSNSKRLVAYGETDEYDRTAGHVKKLNDAIRTLSAELPAGTQYQHLEHNGAAWAVVDDITLPTGNRVLTSAGGDIYITASDEATDSVILKDGDGNSVVTIANGAFQHNGSLGFMGATPIARQTVNWDGTEPQALQDLLAALVAIGIIDGACV